MIISLADLSNIPLYPKSGDIIYLSWEIAAGKTTLTQHLLERFGIAKSTVKSPTYTYYQHYRGSQGESIYHFDLYRLADYETFINIGGQEILENREHISIVEWPEILGERFNPVCRVQILKTDTPDMREIIWNN
jgi:tRNA threonylcarbamoyl adenosine modification protein YjeE